MAIRKVFISLVITALLFISSLLSAATWEHIYVSIKSSYTDDAGDHNSLGSSQSHVYNNKVIPLVNVQEVARPINSRQVEVKIESTKALSVSYKGLNLGELENTSGPGHFYLYSLKLDNLIFAYTETELLLADRQGNTFGQSLAVYNFGGQSFAIMPFSDYEIIEDKNNFLAPVSKEYQLSADFVPADLENIQTAGVATFSTKFMLRKSALVALQEMYNDMEAEGLDVLVTSSYRSYYDQQNTYAFWIGNTGSITLADSASARPGFSEHQLGTTIDIVNSETNYKLNKDFIKTNAGKWLNANA